MTHYRENRRISSPPTGSALNKASKARDKLHGAAEARRAHNPEVTRSKRVAAKLVLLLFFSFFLPPFPTPNVISLEGGSDFFDGCLLAVISDAPSRRMTCDLEHGRQDGDTVATHSPSNFKLQIHFTFPLSEHYPKCIYHYHQTHTYPPPNPLSFPSNYKILRRPLLRPLP